ncbi:MAG: methyltransferase domain-containing protein [Alphaproteobacteria bacterium]
MTTTPLHDERLDAVLAVLRSCRARTVLDLGCGEAALTGRLAAEPAVARVVGIELSAAALRRAQAAVGRLEPGQRGKVELRHGSLTEAPACYRGFDAAVLVETIEHVMPDRLSVLERAVFGRLRPGTVVVTTPNADFNSLLGVPAHRFRHPEHRFEWGRAKFAGWAAGVAGRNGYSVALHDVGGAHPVLGGPSQMAVFAVVPGAG